MELEIITNEKQDSLKRTKIIARIVYQEKATPSRLEVRDSIASKVKATSELVVVKHISSSFGKNESTVEAYAYSDEKSLKQFENEYMIKRNETKKEEAEGQ